MYYDELDVLLGLPSEKAELALKKYRDARHDIYIGKNNIPASKLNNAFNAFPIKFNKDEVLLLVDTTIFGSSKIGVVITPVGVYWNNDYIKTKSNFIYWEHLNIGYWEVSSSQRAAEKAIVPLGRENYIQAGTADCGIVISQILEDLLYVWDKEWINNPELHENLSNGVEECRDIISRLDMTDLNLKLDSMERRINSWQDEADTPPEPKKSYKNLDSYEDALVAALALMMVADRKITDSEIDLAIEFLKEEDLIENKDSAIESLGSIIDDMMSIKSDAIFRLKAKKLMLKIEKVTDNNLVEQIKITLDGMLEASGASSNTKNIDMLNNITALFK